MAQKGNPLDCQGFLHEFNQWVSHLLRPMATYPAVKRRRRSKKKKRRSTAAQTANIVKPFATNVFTTDNRAYESTTEETLSGLLSSRSYLLSCLYSLNIYTSPNVACTMKFLFPTGSIAIWTSSRIALACIRISIPQEAQTNVSVLVR